MHAIQRQRHRRGDNPLAMLVPHFDSHGTSAPTWEQVAPDRGGGFGGLTLGDVEVWELKTIRVGNEPSAFANVKVEAGHGP